MIIIQIVVERKYCKNYVSPHRIYIGKKNALVKHLVFIKDVDTGTDALICKPGGRTAERTVKTQRDEENWNFKLNQGLTTTPVFLTSLIFSPAC